MYYMRLVGSNREEGGDGNGAFNKSVAWRDELCAWVPDAAMCLVESDICASVEAVWRYVGRMIEIVVKQHTGNLVLFVEYLANDEVMGWRDGTMTKPVTGPLSGKQYLAVDSDPLEK